MKPQQIFVAIRRGISESLNLSRLSLTLSCSLLNKLASSNLKLWGDLTHRSSPWRRWPSSWTSCWRRLALGGSRPVPAHGLGSSQTFRLRRRPRRELPLVEMSELRKLLLPHHLSWSLLETLDLLKSLCVVIFIVIMIMTLVSILGVVTYIWWTISRMNLCPLVILAAVVSTCVCGENRCKEGKTPLSWVGDCKIMQNTQFLDVSLELEVSVQVCWGEETVPAPKMIDKPYNQ